MKIIRTIAEANKYGLKMGDKIDMPEPVRKVKQKESE
jgi:hypothetical protein